jgi:mannose-6-phosphate isomerase-like protein (cupin superfamily)
LGLLAHSLMKHIKTTGKREMFKVLLATRSAQAAMMTLRQGQSSSDEPENEHPKCEQWLFVISGSGQAIVNKSRIRLAPGSLLLIEKNEAHRIKQTGTKALITLNFYVPPAYTQDGDVKPTAKR